MRFLIVAAALAALPMAAHAQTEPAMKGPFYVTGTGTVGTSIVALGTRVREGNMARITRIILLPKATDAAGLPVWRIDAVAEFDCSKRLTRPLILAARDDKGKLLHLFENTEGLEELPPGDATVPPALTAACNGTPPPGAQRIDDFDAWHAKYRRDNAAAQ